MKISFLLSKDVNIIVFKTFYLDYYENPTIYRDEYCIIDHFDIFKGNTAHIS